MEAWVLLAIQEFVRHPAWDSLAVLITSLNDRGMIAIATCLVLLIGGRTRRVGAVASLSLLCNAVLVNLLIKPLVARVRPYEVIEGLHLLVSPQSDYSFPSGHAAAAFAVAVVLLRLMPRRIGVPATIAAALIALSRLYVGVHYLTDVLAGVLIGSLVALLACHLLRGWVERGKFRPRT